MIDYKSLAKTAAVAFIQNKAPLNETITKLAEDNSLNPSQIQRVSELSNKAVHQYYMLKSADKNFSFDLADSKAIIDSINNHNDGGLVSSFEPEKPKQASADVLYSIFGNPERFDISKVAHAQERIILREKFAAALREIDSRITYTSIQKHAELQELKTQVGQLKAYGIKPEDIRQTLIAADPQRAEEINTIMKTVSGVESGTPADKAPQDVPVVLNPKHPVVIRVRNVFSQNDTLHNLTNACKYLSLKKLRLEEAQK